MELEKYQDFEVGDFVLDLDFKESVFEAEGPNEALYAALLERFPEKRSDLIEARELVFNLDKHYQKQRPSAQDKAAVYQNILQLHQERNQPQQARFRGINGRLAVAASLLMLIASAVWYLSSWNFKYDRLYATNYSEVASYVLPDGTEVSLNANSTLELLGDWKTDPQREVRLKGEAFFKVKKKEETQAKFIVRTEDPDIEVLGTQFNVNTREGRTLVMLEEGKIKLTSKESKQGPKIMKPGQLADYQPSRKMIISDIDPTKYRRWLKGYFSVDDLSLAEVITEVERIYGLEVQLEDGKTQGKGLVTGVLPIQNIDELILTFETLYNVTITRKDGTLYIR